MLYIYAPAFVTLVSVVRTAARLPIRSRWGWRSSSATAFTYLSRPYWAVQARIDPISMNRWCQENASPGSEGD
jgi:hypothetical protein